MKRLLSCLLGLGFTLGSTASAQKVPSPADWERLHLRQNWSTFVPVEGRDDSLQRLKLIDNNLFVQNYNGSLICIDALTGARLWTFFPPVQKRALMPVTANDKIVFLLNTTTLFLLDRTTGKVIYSIELGATPSAGMTADSERVYVPLINNQVVAYRFVELVKEIAVRPAPQEAVRVQPKGLGFTAYEDLATNGNRTPSISVVQTLRSPYTIGGIDESPSYSMAKNLRPPFTLDDGTNRTPSIVRVESLISLAKQTEITDRIEPVRVWAKPVTYRIAYDLLNVEAARVVIMPSKQGQIYMTGTTHQYDKFVLKTDADLTAGLGLHDFTIYVPTSDTYMYAYDTKQGLLKWRQPMGGEVMQRPTVTDDSLFVVGGNSGLRRINREAGLVVWPKQGYGRNIDRLPGDKILAVNGKFVYTSDSKNRLFVIDRNRGVNLSDIDLGSLNVALSNDQDDRIILAGSDGRLVCLQDRDYRVPTRIKKLPPKEEVKVWTGEEAPKKEPEPKKEEMKKEPEPKKEEMKKEPEPKKDPEPEKKDPEKKDADPKMD